MMFALIMQTMIKYFSRQKILSLQTSLVYSPKKSSLHHKEVFFSKRTSLVLQYYQIYLTAKWLQPY